MRVPAVGVPAAGPEAAKALEASAKVANAPMVTATPAAIAAAVMALIGSSPTAHLKAVGMVKRARYIPANHLI
jgi:hypothetical protein